jgi:ADP-heptose:LPS heptosyltransferase
VTRILFISATNLGDAVLTTGVLSRLIEQHPDADITTACGPGVTAIFKDFPEVRSVIPMAKKKFAGHWLDLARLTIGSKWDIVVDLRNTALSRLYIAKKRYVWTRHDKVTHKVVQIAGAMDWQDNPPDPRFPVTEQARQSMASLRQKKPLLVLGPTAKWPGKMWPHERYAELALRLTKPGAPLENAHIAVVAAKGEEDAAQKVLNALPADRAVDMVAKYSLAEIAAVLETASLYIGNDSGLTHFAAACGAPTLGLFGPGWPELYRPWGKKSAFVQTPEKAEELMAPYMHDIDGVKHSLMTSLSVGAAEQAAKDLLSRITC